MSPKSHSSSITETRPVENGYNPMPTNLPGRAVDQHGIFWRTTPAPEEEFEEPKDFEEIEEVEQPKDFEEREECGYKVGKSVRSKPEVVSTMSPGRLLKQLVML